MMFRRFLAIFLSGVLVAAALAGCSEEADEALPEDAQAALDSFLQSDQPPGGEWDWDGEDHHTHIIDYEAAFAAFAPDTVMISAGDFTVTWDELFFHLCSNIYGLQQNIGEIHNWSDPLYTDMTLAEAVLSFSIDNALLYKAVEYGAGLSGASLSADDLAMVQEEFVNGAEQLGGEDEYLRLLWENEGISSRELFDYLVKTSILAGNVFASLYGEGGVLLSDEDAAEYVLPDGYLMAKHILRLKPEEGEDTSLSEAEEILGLLDSYSGDDFETFFDALMWENSDDVDALSVFPNGYLFQYGDMVPEFFDACEALEIGEYSGIVETEYGYHILYRLPIDFDEVPSYYYRQYDFSSLRYIAAMGLFDSVLFGWKESLAPVFSAEHASIDIAVIFDIGGH